MPQQLVLTALNSSLGALGKSSRPVSPVTHFSWHLALSVLAGPVALPTSPLQDLRAACLPSVPTLSLFDASCHPVRELLGVLPGGVEPIALSEARCAMTPFTKAEIEGDWKDGCSVFSSTCPGHFQLRCHGSRILIQTEINSRNRSQE